MAKKPGSDPMTAEEIAVIDAVRKDQGMPQVCAALGVSVHTLRKILLGEPIHHLTLLVVRDRLSEITNGPPT